MKYACGIAGLSEDFIFMNDDYFLTAPIPEPLPYYYKNTLKEAIKKNRGNVYEYHLIPTLKALEVKGHPTKNFDTHCPMIVNREKMLEVINSYNWNGLSWGYTLRSLYCNTLEIQGEFKPDLKLAFKRFEPQILRMLKDSFCFSIGDKAINKSLLNVMNQLYPNKSKFEEPENKCKPDAGIAEWSISKERGSFPKK